MKFKMEINEDTFVRTHPPPQMRGGGCYIRSEDQKFSFLTTFMKDEQKEVLALCRKITNFLNGDSQ